MTKPDITIIIRTLNEERYLDDLLKAIGLQKTSLTHETILIDSGSDDKTLEIAKSHKCKILHIKRKDRQTCIAKATLVRIL